MNLNGDGDTKTDFTEEELRRLVRVPAAVEDKLRIIVEKCLERSGMYHQVFSRIKSPASLTDKFLRKNYNDDKKIQDLIGIRIDLYFEDDLKIVRRLMERLFGEAEWSRTEFDNEEFRPQKINGVFKLPQELRNMISDETWDCYIDDTFEIQLKTVFFEGWHEIEHDMKYKGADLWEGKNDRARYFNTILATLELCDKSIVTLFENLGHDLYHEKNWDGMIKAHFRLKTANGDLYPELSELFDKDTRTDNVPKRIFKTNREDLINGLLSLPSSVPLNINTIIAVINDMEIHDPEVARILDEQDVFENRSEKQPDDEMKYDLRIPDFMSTFHADVILDTDENNRDERFVSAVNTIYSWVYNKFSGVLMTLDKNPVNTDIKEMGFRIKVDYRQAERIFVCQANHIDPRAAGRIMVTSAIIMPDNDGELRLLVDNGFTYYPDKNDKTDVTRMFSCPRFYKQIASQIGVKDVWPLGTIHCITESDQVPKLVELICDDYRTFPVVIVISAEMNEGRLDESWLKGFAIRYILEKTGHYAHFARMYKPVSDLVEKTIKESGQRYEMIYDQDARQGIVVVNPKKNGLITTECFSEEHIANCSFASFEAIEHLMPFRKQDNGKAFGSELLQLLRRLNTDHDPYKIG